jgi:hypothetical protein
MTERGSIVGRVVKYWGGTPMPNHISSYPGPDPEGQPLAAFVVHVVRDTAAETVVNLVVFDINGVQYPLSNVTLFQPNTAPPEKVRAAHGRHAVSESVGGRP